mgnify:CR=1 FL=1
MKSQIKAQGYIGLMFGIFVFAVFFIMFYYVFKSVKSNPIDNNGINQEVISKAKQLYEQKKDEGMEFLSQCLGTIKLSNNMEYVVDIVHVPRSEEDNKPENQCEDYRQGKVKHFIELDKEGKVVKVL